MVSIRNISNFPSLFSSLFSDIREKEYVAKERSDPVQKWANDKVPIVTLSLSFIHLLVFIKHTLCQGCPRNWENNGTNRELVSAFTQLINQKKQAQLKKQ